ncbi:MULTISPECIES: D-arabinono-1,4-lactone oxidase [Cryobacterium]|uniref:FAD-binding protein n=1 Tax=Cryobacterium breve TaxID=1259258 RepID=A0ABY2J2Y2_9MICO|nr:MULTISPECIES: D-arabinono-1,4-lactone oxidase [Cryobacterium]TFC90976.1 FAD-binding protein [Cryobacterium sp. TmT3-12]TFC99295.1 FAD-binding protein [Cryobacterium breve]
MSASGALWRNWARNQAVTPVRVERPSTAAAVQRAVVSAGKVGLRVKAVGSGHSFSGIALAPGVQLDLLDLAGLIDADPASGQVTLAAGTRLFELPRLLRPYGLALANMGDVDRQTISGALSTGTHGTGGRFGGLATHIVALTLVTGDGSLLRVSETENAELLAAARIGLGALGIVVDVTLQCVPAYLLHSVEAAEPLEEVLDSYLDRSERSDHFEFFWFPHTETALTKTNTRLPLESGRSPAGRVARWVDGELLANGAYRGICALGAALPATVPRFNRLATRFSGQREFTDVSHRVFVTNRAVRFQEMEYALPRALVPAALREVQELIAMRGWNISFPVEVRSAAADDVWLSTANERDTGYIAVHRYYREDPAAYFQGVEAIMRGHGGRPHWGKVHDRDAASLRADYPHFDDFLSVRDRLDPERRFNNSYLERVLGR